MEIWHRVAFNGDMKSGFKTVVEKIGIEYGIAPLPNHTTGLVYFDIDESDRRWTQVEELIRAKGASDIYDTLFTTEEILNAEWVRLIPTFEQGYPQPKATWVTNPVNYENACSKCGTGFRQMTPFRLAKEPRLGKNDFMTLYWTYALFATPKVFESLETHEIRGYERWKAIIHKTNQPCQTVSQLYIPHVSNPGLAELDKVQTETCSKCRITKYAPHMRGYMCYSRDALLPDLDIQLTDEWFGSGAFAFREILISNRFARLILDEGWQGMKLKPIRLM